jgi:hypothetical protein
MASVLEEVGRLTVRLLMSRRSRPRWTSSWVEFLGRAPYERRSDEHPAESRNGWQSPVALKATMGPVELSRPKLRDTDEKFCSQLFGLGLTRTNALEALVVSAWVRGLSDHDIEAALREVLGEEAAPSKSSVSRICQQVKDEFAEFAARDLSKIRLGYLFLDGTNFRFHEHNHRRADDRCSAPGASTPTASPTSSASLRRSRSPPMLGGTSWKGSSSGDLARHSSSFPTARRD